MDHSSLVQFFVRQGQANEEAEATALALSKHQAEMKVGDQKMLITIATNGQHGRKFILPG
jgi:hypothetical protein